MTALDSDCLRRLEAAIQPDRLLRMAWELVNIPSPTGDTRAATEHYAGLLSDAGLRVRLTDPLPNAPNLAATLEGTRAGPTLQFDGHIDTIAHVVPGFDGSERVEPLPHPPPRIHGETLYGRGAADMKGGLAVIAEAARVFAEVGFPYPGRLLVTTHGWHEAPFGYGQDVREMIRAGDIGDAALIAEGPHDFLAVAGRGMAIFRAVLTRDGDVQHENATPPGTPHPLFAAGHLLARIEAFRARLAERSHVLLQPETIFVGEAHGGDFYNRFPNRAQIVGTRRWHPERSFEDVQAEFGEIVRSVGSETGVHVAVEWQLVREGYRVPDASPIVAAASESFRLVRGSEPRIEGFASVGDAATWTREGGVPALWFGPRAVGAHSDLESIALPDMVERTRMFLAAAVAYFSMH